MNMLINTLIYAGLPLGGLLYLLSRIFRQDILGKLDVISFFFCSGLISIFLPILFILVWMF
jgi:hypothetical protein